MSGARPLALGAAAVLGGCAQGAREDAVIRFAVARPPRNLDPRLATDATSERVNRLLYRTLVRLDAAARPVPGLARWERLGATRYRFRLGEQGRLFSDGSRLTAHDVVATLESIRAPGSRSPHRAALAGIAALRARDDDTLELVLHAPDAALPSRLVLAVLPAAAIARDHPFVTAPIGSGPLRLVERSGPDDLLLERCADGQRIALVTVRDPSVRVMKLLRGEVDLLQGDLPPELVDHLARAPGIAVRAVPGANLSYLGFNLEDPRTGSLAVRRAIAQAIDRPLLIRTLLGGRARLAESTLPPEHWAGRDDLMPWPHDPERAQALLAGAGFGPGNPLHLTLKTSSDPFRLRLAGALQAQLAAAGIALAVQGHDWGTFFGDVKAGRFTLYALTWVGVRSPDIFRYALHSESLPPGGANRGRYRNASVDRLIATAARAPSLAAARAPYAALQAIVHAELALVPLWYEDQVAAQRATIRGYRPAGDGNYDGLAQVVRVPVAAKEE
ncbi:peptide ABC transporter substrate-binding protein [Marichromatium purpuratum 984]|uniref:Peptide ABC transporter substrate-binding protein n=1 Tax=Marichromatium purpuratum 984 TaxID=765910 RepID=W0E5U0_MARPU|nr:ABC transporter substrate-binding protein [Marichromatium purpuratum]AHF04431.1 peptide ABC transporter substrate-binding protein [Marichromatium purpuratum 984]